MLKYGNFIKYFTDLKSKGFFYLFAANILIQLFNFGSQFFVAWILTPTDIGVIKILQGYLTIFVLIGTFGFNASVLKLCSEIRSGEEKYYLFKKAYQYTSAASAVTLVVIYLLASFHLFSVDPIINKYIFYYSLLLIPLSFVTLDIAYVQALKKIKMLGNIQIASKILSILLLMALTYFYELIGYIIALGIGNVLSNLIFIKYIRTNGKQEIGRKPDINPFKLHFDIAKFSVSANLATQAALYLDIFLLNYLVLDRAVIGQYSFALTIILAFQTITATFQQFLTPYLSEISGNFNSALALYKKYNSKFQIFGVILSAVSIFLIPPVMNYVFNNKYSDSFLYFPILLLAWNIKNLYSLKGIFLWSIGKVNINFYAGLIILPAGLIAGYIAVKYYGALGAAFSTIFVQLLSYIVYALIFKNTKKRHEY